MRAGPLALLALAALAGCADPEPVDPGDPAEPLPLPDLSGVDFEAAFGEALQVALGTDLRAAWTGHADTVQRARPGCPDLWAGGPEALDDDVEYGDGLGWQDHCTTAADIDFGGFLYWENDLSAEGDPESVVGATVLGARRLSGEAVVVDGGEELFAFVGEGTDSLYRNVADGYEQWAYTSTVEAEVRGARSFAAEEAGGWRADLHVAYSGGASAAIEVAGDVHLGGRRLAERFDSVSADLALAGPGAATPQDCELEPRGWLSLRDTNAYWYELVFLPRTADDATETYENEPYGSCDGCGTLFVRGVEQGEVCLGFDSLWDGALQPPAADEFILSLREDLGGQR